MPDLIDALAARDAGMAQALDHATDLDATWPNVALAWVRYYATLHAEFVAEDCIAAARAWGLAVPVPKAFGSVFQRAAKWGFIVNGGFVPSKNRHGSPTVLWRSTLHHGGQT